MGDAELVFTLWAVALGGLSAVSLPLGSLVGLTLRPPLTLAAVLAAFGAGALIAALAVELVAPTVEEAAHGHAELEAFWALVVGSIVGGVAFVALDRLIASRGGFLRKLSTTITWFTRAQQKRHREMLEQLCAVPLLRMLPPDQVELVVDDVRPEFMSAGEVLFREGDIGEKLYFVREGELEIQHGGRVISTMRPGSVVGEIAMLADVPRTATAVARSDVELLALRRADFTHWRSVSPELDRQVRELASERLSRTREKAAEASEEERAWGKAAIEALREGTVVPNPAEVRAAADQHSGAPLAVWLGMLIDGIPESIVIGSSFAALLGARLAAGNDPSFAEIVPYTLIAGLTLSNFPEALSSSMGMRMQGWTSARVMMMWLVLVTVTALGSGVGFLVSETLSPVALRAFEGLAAGAMLTMISSTMIPESVQFAASSARVGLATLFGFLAAVSFKLLE